MATQMNSFFELFGIYLLSIFAAMGSASVGLLMVSRLGFIQIDFNNAVKASLYTLLALIVAKFLLTYSILISYTLIPDTEVTVIVMASIIFLLAVLHGFFVRTLTNIKQGLLKGLTTAFLQITIMLLVYSFVHSLFDATILV